ncbi:Replication protein [Streptococcus sp. DD10]|uniref:Rep family protein n=1 Tax=Streptococcus sp. DD10 TaxID=1777878 RepID=UPI00079C8FC9|nr:Rep family protein [Streptococcus sp. DD10]KXT74180.1 Replication protein [Streptococcus sp. DD10]
MAKNKIDRNARKRKYFGQISYDYEYNANSSLTEDDFRKSVEQRIKELCQHENDKYYFIFHDKDLKDDGTPKPLHAHFYIEFKNPRVYSTVYKALQISRQENLEFVRSTIKACRYLTHRNERNMEESKFPYEVSEVIASKNGTYIDDIMGKVKNHSVEKSDEGLEVSDYCLELSYKISEDGLLPSEAKQHLFEQFTQRTAQKAWNSNKRQFEDNRQEYIQKEFIRMSKGERHHNGIFIFAEGGTGKSFLSRLLAEEHDRLGAHTPSINKKRFDLGSGYQGQKTIIINELDATCGMAYRELFQILEPDSANQLSSRFKDAYIINDLTIMTNSESYWSWCNSWFGKNKKEYHQLMRRIRFVIKMYHDDTNQEIIIELWHYYATRDLKEKARQAFKKIDTFHLKDIQDEEAFRNIASNILKKIQETTLTPQKATADTSTDQSETTSDS